ncbi:hypothetical protein CMU93_08115 [Elizabethkingia anophelis]|nr:hypothetical protein [Elizabethkingia anophelis]
MQLRKPPATDLRFSLESFFKFFIIFYLDWLLFISIKDQSFNIIQNIFNYSPFKHTSYILDKYH